jgi:hypothetical protein
VVIDTVEKEEANARIREEKEARMRCERELANSRLAYEMLRNELADMRKKHDRQRALKVRYDLGVLCVHGFASVRKTVLTNSGNLSLPCKYRYRAEVKQLKMAHPEREIVKHFSYVTARTVPITARVRNFPLFDGKISLDG